MKTLIFVVLTPFFIVSCDTVEQKKDVITETQENEKTPVMRVEEGADALNSKAETLDKEVEDLLKGI